MLPPPTSPHFPPCSLAMKSLPHLLLLLILLPQIEGFSAINIKSNRKAGEWLSSKNILAAKQGKTDQEIKQILKQLFRSLLKYRVTKQPKKAFTVMVSMEDFRKLFSKVKTGPSKPYMERIM